MIKKNISKFLVAFVLALLLLPGAVYAQFEPSAITIDDAGTGSTPQLVPDGTLDAVITTTTADTSGYSITSYVYTWNNSNTALDDDELGVDDSSVPHGDTIVISTDADAQFGNSDGYAWYLHVKTLYFSAQTGIALSDDTIAGPYTFDNVAPSATISLDQTVEGQTASTASGSPVTIAVNGELADINAVYVNTSEQFNTATANDFSLPSTSTLTYAVDGTGSKTLYAWFEDATGNISDPVTLTFTILAGKSMDPAGDLTLGIGNTQVFQIAGAGAESYTWTIVDAADVATLSTAASVEAGAYTAVVTGVSEGTVKVKAETDGADPIYSGEITVAKLTSTKSYTLIFNEDNTSINAISLPFTVAGLDKVEDLFAKIENCSGIQWWDAPTQTYKGYNKYVASTNIDLVVGAVYFVSINNTPSADLSFEGVETTIQFSLIKNEGNTSINSVSIPHSTNFTDVKSVFEDVTGCQGIQWWDAATQTYKGYNKYVATTNISVNKGDCFFISVDADVNWP